MATTSSTVRTLVSASSITYIKPMVVRIVITDARPNTVLYPFFDGERIDSMCQPFIGTGTTSLPPGELPTIDMVYGSPGALPVIPYGSKLMTNANGELVVYFQIPGGKFTTGDKEIVFADVQDLAQLDIAGNVYGSARAVFGSKGILETYQSTKTVTTVEIQYYTIDPLAQSFFTYGIPGGLFVSSIDLYFQSKDPVLPVRVELREMENGYPKKNNNVPADLVCVVNSADVNVSQDASAATNFKFKSPVYLNPDSDYCFVVLANTTGYNIWTSKLGERSKETGAIIYDQPHTGSMFKSENNITWTAEQFEDIKFKINKAVFDTTITSDLTFVGAVPAVSVSGNNLLTTSGSDKVVYRALNMHGLLAGSKIGVAADATGTYNGIVGTNITGTFNVTRIIDDYTVEFQAAAAATSSGKITTAGIVRNIAITNSGTGYTSTPTVTIGAPSSGTTATGTAVVTNGVVTGITMTNMGSGYTTAPSVVISGGGGTGAVGIASTEAMFNILVNKPMHLVSPRLIHGAPASTAVTAVLKPTNPTYGYHAPVDLSLTANTKFDDPLLIASRLNEYALMSNANSLELQVSLSSTNPNLSPMIDLREINGLMVYANAINNQAGTENTAAVISSSPLTSLTLVGGGTGYSVAPTVTVYPAENDYGVITPAVVTANISGGSVTGFNYTSYGSGYTKTPIVVIAAPSSGTTATATANINPINSEIATAGNSYSRYITKKIALANISRGLRLYVNAISTAETTFDWYIRTTLSSDATLHENATWKLLSCDVLRNKSRTSSEVLEYTFYLDNMAPFDTYDLKMVPSSTNPTKTPYIKQYRVVVLA